MTTKGGRRIAIGTWGACEAPQRSVGPFWDLDVGGHEKEGKSANFLPVGGPKC